MNQILTRMLFLLTFSAIGTYFCGWQVAIATAATEKIPVGVLLPLSGPYAAVGKDCELGIEIAAQANHTLQRVAFKYEDVQAEPRLAVAAFSKAVESSNAVAMIAVRGPVGMAVNPLSSEKRVLLLGAVGHSDFASNNPYAVQLWSTGQEEGVELARRLTAENARRVAIFSTEDEWLQSVSSGLKQALAAHGQSTVFDHSFPSTETDFQSLVSRARSLSPDAIVINVSIGQLGILAKRIREQGFKGSLWANFWFSKPEVLAAAGDAAEGVRYVEMKTNYPRFQEQATQLGRNQRPSAMVYSCYCAASYLALAISDASSSNGEVTRQTLAEMPSKIKRLPLLDGELDVIKRKVRFPITARSIKGGQVIDLE